MTLVELLLWAMLSIVLLGISTSLITSTVTDQPQVSQKAANIQTARVALYGLTREIRNGQAVTGTPTASSVSYTDYVRRSTCGGTSYLSPGAPSTLCQVTYTYCSGGFITRAELAVGQSPATPCTEAKVVSGLSSSNVFSYSPDPATATYIQVNLVMPNPNGPGNLTISDGSTLRNGAALAN